MNLQAQAKNLLLTVKMQEPKMDFVTTLANASINELKMQLTSDHDKKAFWINIYNAYYQILRSQGHQKPAIYTARLFDIAGQSFSLDDVEHGILRRFKYKYSLGFLSNIFVKRRIKRLAVDQLDYRIHFALNCGAKSCPPIAFYDGEKIDTQLDLATQSYLEAESEFDHNHKVLRTTALFKWFLADFNGMEGIRKIYRDQLNIEVSGYKILFNAYSWEDDLNNFNE